MATAPWTATPCAPEATEPVTLHDALDAVASQAPDTPVVFPDEDEALTTAELARRARRGAAALASRGIGPGDRVGVLAPNAPEFLVALVAITRTGAAAAPLALPMGSDLVDWATRLHRTLGSAGVAHVVVSHRIAARVAPALEPVGVTVIDDGELDVPDDPLDPSAPVDVGAPAIIQFTSGSTSRPKGVVLTHANVWHCARAITTAIRLGPGDVHGSWLPLFHDMGLFGALTGILRGVPVHLWSPAGFVRRPGRWLAAFAAVSATISTMPNFGYDALVRAVEPGEAAGLDLSAWRVAFNGAEAVSAAATEAFLERFAPTGFRPSAMVPAYGMAEATLVATLPPAGRPPVVEHVDRDRLTVDGTAVPVDAGAPGARALVGLGRPVPDMAVRIADATGPVPDGTVGEIQLRGAMVTAGYLPGTAGATDPFTPDGWLRTGDLGYRRDDELFFTGRHKEMITVAGRNLYPADVEELARELPGVHRQRCVAVAGADSDGAETIELVVETADPHGPAAAELVGDVRTRVAAALGPLPLVVLPVPPRTIPRTTSGKVRRLDIRALFPTPDRTPGDPR